MDEVIQITKDIKAGNIKPIYFFMGEEPYYIDKLTDFIQENILQEHERDFNQTIIYGRDTTIEEVVSNAKRYPMMADRQVVIVREAQELSRYIDKLESYVENPQPTTVLVFAYKYKTLDKRKRVTKLLEKFGVVFESKKLYDNQVGDWIKRVLSGQGYAIEPKASSILVEFLGTDLSKISNELDKLKIILHKGHTITAKDIEENIGFSKDFNNFELRSALGEKNQLKSYQIVDYFAQNPKDNPLVVTTAMVFSYFSQLLQYHGLKDKSKFNVAKELKINPFFVKDYELAARNYPMRKVSAIVGTLRDIDVKSKGVGAASMTQHDLLKEMLINIFN
ncbi:DNA polymerase III subunit delta [Flavobacterium psychraquaticum]|uniref:DNA polymerase III subunit delta n=1 Tax=Flavobacterium psychraquaticum TaxID=3103958 RepID=UPI002ACF06D8|nr:DNA polymerase III subunit delta [Flavobacterium sp. LB-N7T]